MYGDNQLILVENGQAKAGILLSGNPSAKESRSAKIIKEHIEKITDTEISMLKISDLKNPRYSLSGIEVNGELKNFNFILIGSYDFLDKLGISFEGLGPEGMIIKTAGNVVVISGNDEQGLRHATYTFLEELGCRYLWPGELGKVIPKKNTLYISKLDIKESPRLWTRNIRVTSPKSSRILDGLKKLNFDGEKYKNILTKTTQSEETDDGWLAWHRMGGHKQVYRAHSYGDYWEKYGKDHPDWFALQPNGIRDQSLSPDRCRLCLSNRELINEIIKNKIQELGKKPTQDGVAIGLNDGGRTTFCMCENCRKLDPPEGRPITLYDYTTGNKIPFQYVSLTDRVLWFSNQIAEGVSKVFPDKHLGYDAYSAYYAPPINVKPHPNLIICFVNGSYTDDEARKQILKDWDEWSKYGNKMFYRPNSLLANRDNIVPQNFSHKIFEDMKYLYDSGMIGTDFDSCEQHWALMGLTYYVLAKSHWNPDKINIDSLIDDYCEKGFEGASEYIKKYFSLIENVCNEAAEKKINILEVYSDDIFQKLNSYLEKAENISKNIENKKVFERVEFLKVGLKFGELQVKKYNISKQLKEKADPEIKEKYNNIQKEYLDLLKKIIEENPTAVNVPIVA